MVNQTTAIITGANSGVGFETSRAFAQKGIRVIMACRSEEKGEKAKVDILKEYPDALLDVMELDLSSMDSIRKFAAQYQGIYSKLDLLINNAGVMMPPLSRTKDGFELQFGVNYLGHFLLTGLLLPQLKESEEARVVTVSSLAHKNGVIDFDNLNADKEYSKGGAYGQSKLACLMFAYELERRLRKDPSCKNIKSLAAHPGVSLTNLGVYLPKFVQWIAPLFTFMFNSPENAAMPSVLAACEKDANGGCYYGPTGSREMKGKAGVVDSNELSKDPVIASRLWIESQKLVGYSYL